MSNKSKDKKHTHLIKNSNKILCIEGLSKSVDPEEILIANQYNGFSVDRQKPYNLEKYNFTIKTKALFGGIECEKKYIYHGGKLKLCNYAKHNFSKISVSQKMYEEIVKYNGTPDIIDFDKDIFSLQYTWNGSNGTIVYNYFYHSTVVIVFKLEN